MTDQLINPRTVGQAGNGDSEAGDFRSVYESSLPRLVRLAHLITGSNGAAEDVVHDVFVAAYRRWEDIGDPEGYLYRAVVNRCRSVLRRRTLEVNRVKERTGVVLPPEIDEVWTALQEIPPRRRTALVLRYYADLPVDAVAELMNCRSGTVRSLIHRGHESLRKVLEQ